jgi:hypothetical protein
MEKAFWTSFQTGMKLSFGSNGGYLGSSAFLKVLHALD